MYPAQYYAESLKCAVAVLLQQCFNFIYGLISEISCPELEPPVNGALVHDTVLTRPMRQLICNDNYDIPDLGTIPFNGILWCTDNGDWTPFQTVPNCIGD